MLRGGGEGSGGGRRCWGRSRGGTRVGREGRGGGKGVGALWEAVMGREQRVVGMEQRVVGMDEEGGDACELPMFHQVNCMD